MIFERIYDTGLAQAAYLIGCEKHGIALVVDPAHDIDRYLDAALAHDLRIVAVAETHIHADFLSGARALARACDATLCVSDEGNELWRYRNLERDVGSERVRRLHHGDRLELGTVELVALHTPGHSIEHLAFVVTDLARSRQPLMLLSGDFVLVGDLGRPDLTRGLNDPHDTRWYAQRLFESLGTRLRELPAGLQLWPAHGAGSPCGRALGEVPASTVGYERQAGWWRGPLEAHDLATFTEQLLDGAPEVPRYFARMKRLNRDAPGTHGDVTLPARLTPRELLEALEAGCLVLDLRSEHAFAERHLRGALSFPALEKLSSHAGAVLDPGHALVLLVERAHLDEATRRLMRVGLGPALGYVPALDPGAAKAVGTAHLELVSAAQAHQLWQTLGAQVVDVRSRAEWKKGHVPGAHHLFFGDLPDKLEQLPRDRPLVVHCATGKRASIACSVLLRAGFSQVFHFAAGPKAWHSSGYPLER